MSALTGLDAQFADGNVTLGVMLGAICALTTVRALLPEPDSHAISTGDEGAPANAVEPFLALLLGAIALHDRLTTLVDASTRPGSGRPARHEPETSGPPDGLLR